MKNIHKKDITKNITKTTRYFQKPKRIEKIKPFLAADIETVIILNKKEKRHLPVSIGFTDGKKTVIYNIWEYIPKIDTTPLEKRSFEDLCIFSDSMITNFINRVIIESIHISGDKSVLIFFHNLSRFDGIFILTTLKSDKFSNISAEVIMRSNKIYEIKYQNIIFRDSLLLLPLSLENCRATFAPNISPKIIFDHDTLTMETILSRKDSLVEYITHDIKILFSVLIEADKAVRSSFQGISLTNCITLPTLSLKIYRTLYMPEDKIYKLSENEDSFIRKGYHGGECNVFIPYGKNLYYYDVNSLYPSAMKNFMPTGEAEYVNFRKTAYTSDFFGFINCEVEYFGDLKNPILPKKDIPSGRLIFPRGKWSSVYFSEEIKNAEKYGYIFTPINGYKFKKERLFDSYIDELYVKRREAIKREGKKSPYDIIMKLLMNSLYGRFGMKQDVEMTYLVREDDVNRYISDYEISSIFELNNSSYTLITGKPYNQKNRNPKEIHKHKGIYLEKNIAVQMAAAITAYARIYMSEFKNLKDNELYYTDTDSVILKYPLPDKFVSESLLGYFKMECIVVEGIFIAPKIYSIIDENDKIEIRYKGLPLKNKKSLDWIYFSKLLEKIPFIYKSKESTFDTENAFRVKLKTEDPRIEKIESIYTPTFSMDKRIRVYVDNKWVGTEPITIDE